jgi:hypothetical protein
VSESTKLEKLLAELPTVRAPAGWRERVRAAIDAGTPPTDIGSDASSYPWWIAGGGVLAAAAAIAIYVAIPDSAPPASSAPSIAMQVTRSTSIDVAIRDNTKAHIGDTIVVRAQRAAALRMYRDGVQVARCPGSTGCTQDSDGLVLALPATAPGTHSAVAYAPALPEPASGWKPSAGDLDADLAAAVRMQIKMTLSAPIDAF